MSFKNSSPARSAPSEDSPGDKTKDAPVADQLATHRDQRPVAIRLESSARQAHRDRKKAFFDVKRSDSVPRSAVEYPTRARREK